MRNGFNQKTSFSLDISQDQWNIFFNDLNRIMRLFPVANIARAEILNGTKSNENILITNSFEDAIKEFNDNYNFSNRGVKIELTRSSRVSPMARLYGFTRAYDFSIYCSNADLGYFMSMARKIKGYTQDRTGYVENPDLTIDENSTRGRRTLFFGEEHIYVRGFGKKNTEVVLEETPAKNGTVSYLLDPNNNALELLAYFALDSLKRKKFFLEDVYKEHTYSSSSIFTVKNTHADTMFDYICYANGAGRNRMVSEPPYVLVDNRKVWIISRRIGDSFIDRSPDELRIIQSSILN
jgi:hypothetical protein